MNLGASQSGTLNESKPKAQHEFSASDKQRQRENTMFDFQEELKKLPHSPGVYIMHDAQDEIIYVGKAIDLHNRVRSYFRKIVGRGPQIDKMVSLIARFEYIVTDSELEALVLENNLHIDARRFLIWITSVLKC